MAFTCLKTGHVPLQCFVRHLKHFERMFSFCSFSIVFYATWTKSHVNHLIQNLKLDLKVKSWRKMKSTAMVLCHIITNCCQLSLFNYHCMYFIMWVPHPVHNSQLDGHPVRIILYDVSCMLQWKYRSWHVSIIY